MSSCLPNILPLCFSLSLFLSFFLSFFSISLSFRLGILFINTIIITHTDLPKRVLINCEPISMMNEPVSITCLRHQPAAERCLRDVTWGPINATHYASAFRQCNLFFLFFFCCFFFSVFSLLEGNH